MTLYQNHKRIEDAAIRNLQRYVRGRWTDQPIPTSCAMARRRLERLQAIEAGLAATDTEGVSPTRLVLITRALRRVRLVIAEIGGLIHSAMTAYEVLEVDPVYPPAGILSEKS